MAVKVGGVPSGTRGGGCVSVSSVMAARGDVVFRRLSGAGRSGGRKAERQEEGSEQAGFCCCCGLPVRCAQLCVG